MVQWKIPVWPSLRRRWRVWRERQAALRTLNNLSNDRLEDIGLTRQDVDRMR
ncbi:DUF1127 domain-containing protein [Dickeya undicola]|uniref:DUF1127 domain-containing protein n=1 Tax=Dickeya undicola TaxID=1577887 RepID=A0ABX9WQP7_9GAMM|nr:DUF1127 domain-containing protein [Dickeya undicola]RNM21405.1 DUF1127 domain-containing protein [Dickeya undicola]